MTGTHRHARDISLQNFFEIGVGRLLSPLEVFLHKQTTAAILLAVATLISLVLANSPMASAMRTAGDLQFGVVFHKWDFLLSIREWVSSGLMAFFFFLIGLELKRETLAGKLRQPREIYLIVMAAVGGMVVPALLYLSMNFQGPGQHGWAIPMATDTAFGIGVLALLAKRVSYGTSVFLLALAIFDDIGAIIVIGLFYSHGFDPTSMSLAVAVLAVLFLVNLAGFRNGWIYAVLGVVLWVFVHNSGVHATLAGLLLAIAVPARTRLGETGFVDEVRELLAIFEKGQNEDKSHGIIWSQDQHHRAEDIGMSIRNVSTPLQRWETDLAGPVGICILPIFALLNAGVSLSGSDISAALQSPVAQGVIAGLLIGKPLGIALFAYIGLRLKLGTLPQGMRLSEVVVVGFLGGIGFTMSLFIAPLSFAGQPGMVEAAKTGIVFASVSAATMAALCAVLYTHRSEANNEAGMSHVNEGTEDRDVDSIA